jgi:hypothetical protein
MITVFWLKWTVHALDKVKIFFGIRFICSPRCITMDQTHKVKQVIIDVFGPSYDKQSLSGLGYATPMISGTEYANKLEACPPFLTDELKTAQTGETFGFGFRNVLGSCMHCALWTCLDILQHVLYWPNPRLRLDCYISKRSSTSLDTFPFVLLQRHVLLYYPVFVHIDLLNVVFQHSQRLVVADL